MKVLVFGPSGSGKTYCSKVLSEKGYPVFDADLVDGLHGWYNFYMNQKGYSSLILILIFSIGVLVVGSYFYTNSNNKVVEQKENALELATATKDIEDTSSVDVPNKNFISNELGIAFDYPKVSDDYYKWPLSVSQSRNRLNLMMQQPTKDPEVFQWVEVFSKDPNQDLATAIRESVLEDYSTDTCLVEQVTPESSLVPNGPSYSYARITVPVDSTAANCPNEYTTTNFVSYFIYDSNYPDKFIYLSLGQEPGPMLPNGEIWTKSIEIFH